MAHAESGLEVQKSPDSSIPQHYVPDGIEVKAPTSQYSRLAADDTTYYDEPKTGPYQPLKPPPVSQRIYGLSPTLFGAVVALITAIIVGAAVGGGLGSALSEARKHQSTSTQTTTVLATTTVTSSGAAAATTTGGLLLNYNVAAPTSVYSIPLDCSSIEGSTYTAANGQTYAVTCKVDQYTGDIAAVLAYSYEECLEACAAMNTWQHTDACVKIQFVALWKGFASGGPYENCWLKNSSAYPTTPGANEDAMSAQLTGNSDPN